jgi:CheY-like chemotaxis protein
MINKKLNKILLVDDSEAINYIHNYILEEMDIVNEVIIKENGADALVYLLNLIENNASLPELIFIDINMPRMNAWEFFDTYQTIDLEIRRQTHVILLTSSIDPADMEKAQSISDIEAIRDKPFDEPTLKELLTRFF